MSRNSSCTTVSHFYDVMVERGGATGLAVYIDGVDAPIVSVEPDDAAGTYLLEDADGKYYEVDATEQLWAVAGTFVDNEQ